VTNGSVPIMRMSVFNYLADSCRSAPVDDYVHDVRELRDAGFDTIWTPQLQNEHDALMTMAIALREVDGVTLGSGVQPIQSRHPLVLAQAALTLSMLSGGRFRLGIGLTHRRVTEGSWGIPWDRPVQRLNEYLDGLLPLLAGERAEATGEIYTTRTHVALAGVAVPPVYVAALGPKLLQIAGRRTAGTITFMTGPRTLAEHVVPAIDAAAEEAGRRAEVIAALPVCVTDDVAGVRELAASKYAMYGNLPSYRSMLDREGAAGPEDIALIGDESTIAARLDEIAKTGVAEFSAHVFGPDERDRARTLTFLSSRR